MKPFGFRKRMYKLNKYIARYLKNTIPKIVPF